LDFTNEAAIMEFAKTDPTAVLLRILAIIPAHILTFVLAWLVVTRFRQFSFRETLGWKWNGFKIWHSFAIFAGFYVVALVLIQIFGKVETDFDRMLTTSRTAVFLVAFFATFTAPLVEEVVYRGLLYSAFQRRFSVVLSVVFVTVLFTAVHIPQYSNDNIPNYASIIILLLLSLTLTLIRVRTDNLLPCIFLHTVVNGIQSLILILYPYIEKYIETHQPQTASLIQLFK
jgi:membrane protease YdiL (CAAX protease family)